MEEVLSFNFRDFLSAFITLLVSIRMLLWKIKRVRRLNPRGRYVSSALLAGRQLHISTEGSKFILKLYDMRHTKKKLGTVCAAFLLSGCGGTSLEIPVVEPGWDIYTGGVYRYGPSIIVEKDGSIDAWFAAPGGYHDGKNLKYDENNNIITLRNLYNSEFPNDITYVSSSEKINSYTGDKDFFLVISRVAVVLVVLVVFVDFACLIGEILLFLLVHVTFSGFSSSSTASSP